MATQTNRASGQTYELLINNFGRDTSHQEIARDYTDLEWMIMEERTSIGVDSRRLAVLNVLLRLELKLARGKLVIE